MLAEGQSTITVTLFKFFTNELIREKAKLPEECEEKEYDTNYYIEHQIIPAVENIFEVFGITKEQIITRKRQKSLSEF